MKIKYIDGKEGDTNTMADVPAMHMEAVSKCREILKEAGLNYFLFSLDSNGGGGGSVAIPDDARKKLGMIQNVDDQFRVIFKECIRVGLWNDEKYDFPENTIPQILKNIRDEE